MAIETTKLQLISKLRKRSKENLFIVDSATYDVIWYNKAFKELNEKGVKLKQKGKKSGKNRGRGAKLKMGKVTALSLSSYFQSHLELDTQDAIEKFIRPVLQSSKGTTTLWLMKKPNQETYWANLFILNYVFLEKKEKPAVPQYAALVSVTVVPSPYKENQKVNKIFLNYRNIDLSTRDVADSASSSTPKMLPKPSSSEDHDPAPQRPAEERSDEPSENEERTSEASPLELISLLKEEEVFKANPSLAEKLERTLRHIEMLTKEREDLRKEIDKAKATGERTKSDLRTNISRLKSDYKHQLKENLRLRRWLDGVQNGESLSSEGSMSSSSRSSTGSNSSPVVDYEH